MTTFAPPTWSPAEEASLRAVFARTELARTKTFEAAMAIPALYIAIRQIVHSLAQTPGELFNAEENKQ